MNIYEAIGVHEANIDDNTGKVLSHEEVYDRAVNYLGGLAAVAPYIPFSVAEIRKALKTDKHLNNLALSRWDGMAGFITNKGDTIPTYDGLWNLYRTHGITTASVYTGVCILKHAARRIAALSDDEIENLSINI